MRAMLIGAGILGLATTAAAQYPYPGVPGAGYGPSPYGAPFAGYGGAPAVMPNFYNPVNQPLSPYLNLLRGGNPGVNYYYGVRPGTVGGAGGWGGGAPFYSSGAMRPPFFPQLATNPTPTDLTGGEPTEGYVLPPAGHPVVFGNTLGYFPGPWGNNVGNRTGLAGIGATPQGTRSSPKR